MMNLRFRRVRWWWWCIAACGGLANLLFRLFTKHPVELANISKRHLDDDDNFLIGKSCFRIKNKLTCRDCGLESKRVKKWSDCPIAKRRNVCKKMKQVTWELPKSRKRSDFDSTRSEHADVNVLAHYGLDYEYHQVVCPSLGDCLDLSRCNANGPITVYAYNQTSMGYSSVQHVARQFPNLVQHVEDPANACTLFVTCDAFGAPEELTKRNTFWNHGKNHFIFGGNACFGSHADRPFPTTFDYELAAIAAGCFMNSHIRYGHDVALLVTNETFTVLERDISQRFGRDRPLLLSFKGNIFNWEQVWWQHRWIAFEHWHEEGEDVIVDAKCPPERRSYAPMERDYTQLLLDSKFAFCPGGGGPHSYRLSEALGLGAIPVVMSDLAEPFGFDWSGCWIRVSEARIVDLPRLLRKISDAEIESRQQRCKALFDACMGWEFVNGSDSRMKLVSPIFAALKVWSASIKSALQHQAIIDEALSLSPRI